MNENLIRGYILSEFYHSYLAEGGTIKSIKLRGDEVEVIQISDCGHYDSVDNIPLLDIMGWMYSKIIT